MATIFKRGSSEVWIASFKVWDAKQGKWTWMQKSTGLYDKTAAAGVAATFGRAALDAFNGKMTRARALAIVNDILRLTGVETVATSPSLKSLVETMEDEYDVSDSTLRKYRAQWRSLREWAKEKVELAVDAWSPQDLTDYYSHCKVTYSATTANDHLGFASRVFARAMALGYVTSNPVEAVARVANDSVEKSTFTRKETADLLRVMRKNKETSWVALSALGWHTGHRIQDLLNVVPGDLTKHADLGWLVELRPGKKARQKGRVVVLPIPAWLALMIRRLGGFQELEKADNRNGRISSQFVAWLRAAGIDPLPVKRMKRTVHLKSFHSNRHSMVSRLIGAGVSGELSRMVTDHTSPQVQRRYAHPEIKALKEALKSVRGR